MNTESLQKTLTAYLICFPPDIFVHFHNALLNLLIYSYWLKRMMLKLMCYDGSFDEVEQIFMEMLFLKLSIINLLFHIISEILNFIPLAFLYYHL